MPLVSEVESASAIRARFGFQDRGIASDSAPMTSSEVLESISKSTVVRTMPERKDEGSTASGLAPLPLSQSFEFSEDPSFWKDHNVQVIIRVRPLSGAEISSQGHSKCVRQESCQTITWTGQPESRFTFDLVADETVSQEKLFKVAGVPMVENCMGGYNSCMFAYGQTGSGKTHTMLGDIEGGTRRHSVNCGMTPRVFEYLFSRIQKEKDFRKADNLKFTCKCSFLEIYNEQILDLLDPSSSNLQIREDVKKGVHVENLKEIEVTSARDVIQQLIQGATNRKVAATNMNHASSRSHSVFTCVIESKWETQGVTHHRFARLNLVDLAGSERQKSSGAEGERLKEATNINKSLSTLGLVIMNLVSISNGKSSHVPYRDSKLTFLLQDSLGGNSKTTIIANISPSLCCSLETLSTLKFAQRAKFIKNNAIVNEDASGDVIAMRLQIQQLKKEVARLHGLANNGAESMDHDASDISFLGSPGVFKWEGQNASFSPLASNKKMTQKKDYELALVGAFKREKDKDISLKALVAENQAALQLAKQREDEIQSLKMRLRFREAAVKRLEAVASGKILAETHLLKEKEEHLREIEVLRNQVDRNQEVTRFAMENLRLKEEIRRLKSFYDEGEREMMSEQVMVLQNKLLEALDWKLMHESDSLPQKALSDTKTCAHDDSLLFTRGSELPSVSSIHEENEFLRMQAIQNQAEIDTLQKQLQFCLEEKEELERHVNDMLMKHEEERSFKASKEGLQQIDMPSLSTVASVINFDDQMELKTMVDAIAAASQREAEAHERAIILSKENNDMRLQLEASVEESNALQASIKALIEEKNSLIEMYERAASENKNRAARDGIYDREVLSDGCVTEVARSKQTEMEIALKNLECQLLEMHEENERLMGLYEKAMHERDEFKRMMSSGARSGKEGREREFPDSFVGSDGGKYNDCSVPPSYIDREVVMEEVILPCKVHVEVVGENDKLETPRLSEEIPEPIVLEGGQCAMLVEEKEENGSVETSKHVIADTTEERFGVSAFMEETNLNFEKSAFSGPQAFDVARSRSFSGDQQADLRDKPGVETDPCLDTECGQNESLNVTVLRVPEDLNVLKIKIETAENKLVDSAKMLTVFSHIEEAYLELDKLSREEEELGNGLEMKQKELGSFELLSSEIQERKALIDKKLSALKVSLSSFLSSVAYFEHREARLRAKLNASFSFMDQKRQELSHLQASKCDIEAAMSKIQQSEAELRNNFALLKSKFEEENQRQENEKVLFAIDNTEKVDTRMNWPKATDLLKSTEEKTKLQTEIKVTREKLCLVRGEFEDLRKKSRKMESEIEAIQRDLEKRSKSVKEMELALHGATQEKDTVLEIREHGMTEIERMVLEYQQNVFDTDLKEAEINILGEELMQQSRRIEELRTLRIAAAERMKKLLEDSRCHSVFLSKKMEDELQKCSWFCP